MANNTFMDKLRSFLGIRQEPPRHEFRNPIWGSDDEDEGDELYSRDRMTPFIDPMQLQEEFTKHMQDMFRSFGNMFLDMGGLFDDQNFEFSNITELPSEGDGPGVSSIRDHYLKPGYDSNKHKHNGDVDLDGKISSNDIAGLLKKKDETPDFPGQIMPFNGDVVPGRSFCQTIITTRVKKPDGTVETKRIVKNGNEVIEETTTTGPDGRSPLHPNSDPTINTNFIYNNVVSDVLTSLFRNFY